jgi:GNAT superfamily N-acetyltransferase
MGAIGGGYLGPVPEIRAATPADAETVFNLLSARSRLLFGGSELSRRLVAAYFALPGFDRWLAVDGNVVLGYGHLAPTQDLVVSASDAAVGDSLLARAEEHARTRGFGVQRVGLKVDAANPTGALELYERAGFVIERHHETWAKPL